MSTPITTKPTQYAWLPLHPAQQEVYYDQMIDPDSPHYNTGGYIVIRGVLNKPLLEQVVGHMSSVFDVLRLVFDFSGTTPMCRLAQRGKPSPMHLLDLRHHVDPAAEARAWMQAQFDRPFNLGQEQLAQQALLLIDDQEQWLFCRYHHLITDASGFAIAAGYVARQYTALLAGGLPVPTDSYLPYQAEISTGNAYLKSVAYGRDRDYWTGRFVQTPARLLTRRAAATTVGSDSLILEIPATLRRTFDQTASQTNTSLQQLTIAALMVCFGRTTQQTEIVLGVPVYNRRKHQWNIMGMFAGLIPFRGSYQADQPVSDLLRSVKHQQLNDYRHQNYPISHLNRDLRLMTQGQTQLFDVVVNYLLLDFDLRFGQEQARTHDLLSNRVENPLQFWWRDFGPNQPLELRVDFQTAYLNRTDAQQLADRVLHLIGQMADALEQPVAKLSLLPPAEERLLQGFNQPPVLRDGPQTLIEALHQQAQLTPDHPAVEADDEQLTYRQLHCRADALAHHLRQTGAGPGTVVAITVGRSVMQFVALLGVLKTGAAYVAIPPDYPVSRQDSMLADSGALVWLREGTAVADHQSRANLTIIDPTDISLTDSGPAIKVDQPGHPTDPAYIIYTSGSTGQPKGVTIPQRALLDYCRTFQTYFALTSTDRVIQQASLAFDTMVEEIYPAWLSGACVVLLRDGGRDVETLADYLAHRRISVLSTTPSVIQWLNRHLDSTGDLRVLISGGEVLHPAQIDRLIDRVSIVNTYGPSESTVCVTYHPVMTVAEASRLGKPITNRTVVITDELGQPLPVGTVGELCIGGAGLMCGYHGQPELTANRLISNPFSPGELLYRSGDLARWLPDGTLEYAGRIDEQVKIRGYRVEPGEVEAALLAAPGVCQATVAVKPDVTGKPRLIGYVVGVPETRFDTELAMNWLRRTLPEYMVPALLLVLPELPLTTNGKVAKAALPNPDDDSKNDRPATRHADPTNDVEQLLVTIWQALLNRDGIGIHDNFFGLGGDSILTLQVVSRMRQAGYTLQPRQVFEHPTIAQLGACAVHEPVALTEQGLLTGETGLLPIQQQFLTENGLRLPGSTAFDHQAILFDVNKTVTGARLQEAFDTILARHDALRFVYQQGEDQTWTQHYGPMPTETVIEVDLRTTSDWSAVLTQTCAVARASLRIDREPLFWCVLMQTPGDETHNRLLLLGHHLAVDGVSWQILLDDLLTILCANATGQPLPATPKPVSYRQWGHALTAYAKHEKTLTTLPYWQTALAVTSYLPTDYPAPAVPVRLSAPTIVCRSLSAALTASLLAEAHRPYRTQVTDLLVTALTQTITDWSGHHQLAVSMDSTGRGSVMGLPAVDKTVGCFTAQFPLALTGVANGPDRVWIQSVKEQLRAVPDGGLGYGAMRWLHPDAAIRGQLVPVTPPDLTFTHADWPGMTLSTNDWISRANQPANAPDPDGCGPCESLLAVRTGVRDGQMTVEWAFAPERYEPETVEKLASQFVLNLTRLVQHCEQVVGEHPTPADFELAGVVTQVELDAYRQSLPDGLLMQAAYRLSPLQGGMLFHSLYEANSIAYIDQLRCTIPAAVNPHTLSQTWVHLIREHSILRTAFPYEAFQTPLQVVFGQADLPIRLIDLSDLPTDAQAASLTSLAETDLHTAFDLRRPPLLRVTLVRLAPARYEMIWTSHHILADGWSLAVLTQAFRTHYETFSRGQQPALRPEDRYELFIRLLEQRDKPKETAFWQQQVANLTQPTLLPFLESRADRNKGAGSVNTLTLTLDPALVDRMQTFLRAERLTINTLCQGVWASLLAQYTNSPDVTFGVTVSGRPTALAEVETRVGLYINTLPFRTILPLDRSVRAWLPTLQQQQQQMQEYAHKPLHDIQQLTPLTGDWFDTLLEVGSYPMTNLADAPPALPMEQVQMREQTNFLLTVVVRPGAAPTVAFSYQPALLSEAIVTRISVHFQQLMEQIVTRPDEPVGRLDATTPEERGRLTQFGTGPVVEPDTLPTVVHQIEAQVRLRPEQVALICGEEQLSFAGLNRQADQLARLLQTHGVGRGQLVGICLERSPMILVAILAVLKTGAAYVPIDPQLPPARVQYLIDDAGVMLILSQDSTCHKIPAETGRLCIPLDRLPTVADGNNPVDTAHISPDDLAYCLYTSGSTGQPKGVRISHRSLAAFVQAVRDEVIDAHLPNQTATVIHLNYAFDGSITALLGPLTAGKTSLIAQGDPQCVFEDPMLWRYAPYDFIKLTPAQLPLLAMAIQQQPTQPLLSHRLIVGGEALLPKHYQFWTDNPTQPVTIINMYGPTEATVGCCWYAFQPGQQESITAGGVVIGQPMPNVQLHVLDRAGRLSALGVVGELYIGGVQLAEGYHNRVALTDERFIGHPLGRLYRTGDLAYWTAEGNLAYCGRCDDQVKIRGHRIEIGEVEVGLQAAPGVAGVTVVVQRDGQTATGLAAYVVLEPGGSLAAVQSYGQAHLPGYMLPAWLIEVPAIPLTVNGKVDKRALPPVRQAASGPATDRVRPETPAEILLAGIWQDVLGLPTVGTNEDFFTLGGDSINSIQVVSRARKEGLFFYPKDIFAHPTIAHLAKIAGQVTAQTDEQGFLTGSVGLLPVQQAFLTNKEPEKGCVSQAVLLRISKQVTPERLEAALRTLVRHHDALRFRYQQTADGWQQDYTDTSASLLINDLTQTPLADLPTALITACEHGRTQLDPAAGPLMRLIWFQTADAENRLFWTIHHLAVDSISWQILLNDLATCLDAGMTDQPVDLGPKTTSYRQWAAGLDTYANAVTTHQQLPYWQAMLATAAPLPADVETIQSTENQTVIHDFSLDTSVTQALLQEANAAYHTEVSDLLLTALSQTVAHWTKRPGLTLGLEGHGREAITERADTSRTVGCFTNHYPVTLTIDTLQPVSDQIRAVKEQIRTVPDKGMGYGALRYLHPSAAVRESLTNDHAFALTFNYLGQVDVIGQTTNWFTLATESPGADVATGSTSGNQLKMTCLVRDGQLQGQWQYAANGYTKRTISTLADQFCTQLMALIRHCLDQQQTRLSPADYGLTGTMSVHELDDFLQTLATEPEDLLIF